MIRFTRSQIQPIGLDIGCDSIKMLQVETVGQTLAVMAVARMPFPANAREEPALRSAMTGDLIRQMLRQGKFTGRRVVAALPREILHVKNLRMPLIPQHELAAAVSFEARNIFPFDPEQAHMQVLPAGEVRQGVDVRQEVIVLAARHQDVDAYLEQLHRFGLTVDALDVEACALYRSQERFIRRREDEQEVQVLVDLGCRRSLVVIGRGREISFMKPIDIGAAQLHEAVSRKLGITLEEAHALRRRLIEAAPGPSSADLLKRDPVRQAVFDATRSIMEDLGREISLCLRYYSVTFRGQRPTRLRLVGGEAADPLLLGVLNAALGVPVEAGRPLYSVDTSRLSASERNGYMSEWAMAFGLGLRMTSGTFAPRDGKPRDPTQVMAAAGTASQPRAGAAEVVDFNLMVESSAGAAPARRADEPAAHGFERAAAEQPTAEPSRQPTETRHHRESEAVHA